MPWIEQISLNIVYSPDDRGFRNWRSKDIGVKLAEFRLGVRACPVALPRFPTAQVVGAGFLYRRAKRTPIARPASARPHKSMPAG
jgi:hypothetical protein